MTVAWEWLHDIKKALDMLAPLGVCAARVISGDGVVHRFAQPFNLVDAEMVNRLKPQFELRAFGYPALYRLGDERAASASVPLR